MPLIICEIIIGILVFFTEACVFSFLNVIVYRLPQKLSFVKGSSFCPSCHHKLGTLDLFPIFSYLFLRGKCRYCKAHIPVRDTIVEIIGGGLALFCAWQFPQTWYLAALTAFAFYAVLAVVTLLDWDTMEIADGCHIAIAALAVISYFTMPGVSIVDRLIGAVCVSVPMLLLALLISGAFGGGDIKLMAACGLFLGWKVTLISTAIGILLGGFYGILLLIRRKAGRKSHFAFGPFLCVGMAIGLPYGQQLIDWYLSIFFI